MSVRLSPATVKVLQAMTNAAASRHYGYSLMRVTGLKSGSLYPILERLQNAGWVESEWETLDEQTPGRPPRRYYRLTAFGQETAPREVHEYLRRADALQGGKPRRGADHLPGGKPRPAWGGVQ